MKKKSTKKLPSVASALGVGERQSIRYFMPGKKAIRQLEKPRKSTSPSPNQFGLREVYLEPGVAITTFIDQKREKAYVARYGHAMVYVWSDGKLQKFNLHMGGEMVVVPRGKPHAFRTFTNKVCIRVIASSKKGIVRWESSAKNLCKNAHLVQS